MNSILLAFIIIFSILIFLGLIIFTLYYVVIPKVIINKLRNGEDKVSNPKNFNEILDKIDITKDIVYNSHFENNTYDIYKPKNITKKLPLVIWVHGGFFIAGSKEGVGNVSSVIASHDYIVCAINYRHAPENKYLDIVRQIDEFIFNVKTLDNVDLDNIILAGDSAGGNLIQFYTSLLANEELQKEVNIKPSIRLEQVKASILVCAPIDISLLVGFNKKLDLLLPLFGKVLYGSMKWYKNDKFNYTKLLNHVNENFPHMILTDAPSWSFEKQNRMLGEKLKEANVKVSEIYFEDKEITHEYLFDLEKDYSQAALLNIINILNNIINN